MGFARVPVLAEGLYLFVLEEVKLFMLKACIPTMGRRSRYSPLANTFHACLTIQISGFLSALQSRRLVVELAP